MKEKKPLNPAEAWRRQQKRKSQKLKHEAKLKHLKSIPVEKRDPFKLTAEIYKLDVLDYQGKLNSDGRIKKKKLMDQFNSLRKARAIAGLEPIELIPFDPEKLDEPKPTVQNLPNLPPSEKCPFETGPPGLPPYLKPLELSSSEDELFQEPKLSKNFLDLEYDRLMNEI